MSAEVRSLEDPHDFRTKYLYMLSAARMWAIVHEYGHSEDSRRAVLDSTQQKIPEKQVMLPREAQGIEPLRKKVA